MEFKDPSHIYEVAPPYLNNRELPALLMKQTVAELKEANPKAKDEEIWQQAKEKVHAENKMVWFGVQALYMPDIDKLDREIANLYNDNGRDKAMDLEAGKRLQQIKEKVKSINNLVVGGKTITTFEDFYAKAPAEMVQWLIGAVRSTITLSLAERKNFLPE